MKSLTIAEGGHPHYHADDLNHLNEAIQEAAAALASIYASSYYLTNTSIVLSGGSMVVQSGYMVYKGEICAFDAQSIPVAAGQTLVWEPVVTYRSCDPLAYADGSSKSPHKIKKVHLAYYAVLPADYVVATDVQSAYKGDWVSLAPINGWVATGAAYRINGNKLELKGRLTAPTPVVSVCFTLPVGFRSAQDRVVPATGGAATVFSTPLSVATTGDMSVDTSEVTDGNHVYLDGVSFYL